MKQTINQIQRIFLFCVLFALPVLALGQIEISNVTGLAAIANDLNGNYKLIANISLTEGWDPIANFSGELDGNGHVISGLKYNNEDATSVALFSTTSGAIIKKLGIENADITAKKDVAAFVGIMSGGKLEECYVSDSKIYGGDHVGSLVGQAKDNALVENCYSSAYIYAATNNTGGLVGSSKSSTLSKSYFAGMIRTAGTSQQAAGLVGFIENGHTPLVKHSVNLSPFIITNGSVPFRIIPNTNRTATLIDNYSLSTTLVSSDFQVSSLKPISESDVHYGVDKRNGANFPNDSDAKSESFYSNVLGWNFNASSGVWKMLDDGYPILRWQTKPVRTTVLNLDAPDELNILDIKDLTLQKGASIDFSNLISSHGVKLSCTSTSSKITITNDNIVAVSSGVVIRFDQYVSLGIISNTDFVVNNSAVKITLSTGYPFNVFSSYPDGFVSSIYNAGPGLAIDDNSVTSEDSKMVVISSTSMSSFLAYIQSLLSDGFSQIYTNQIDNNLFYTLTKNDILYYMYYSGSSEQTRIIQDNSSTALLSELDASTQGSGESELYLYSIDYTHGEGQTSILDYWGIDCGALIILKLPDNSLYLIDSGHERQSSNAALEGLLNFMYKITGQSEGSVINIRGWFYSHAHGDHVYMTYPFLEKYHNLINVESVMFNIPSYQTMSSGYDRGTFRMKAAFINYYPDCKYVKLHSGQKFDLQGVSFRVLHTHEDAVNESGNTVIKDFNDTSTILEMTINGKKIILLGDANKFCQSNLLSMYSSSTLRSDAVQTAHHGFNDLPSLYNAIAAPLALFSNSKENVGLTSQRYLNVMNAGNNVKSLFADPNTVKITVENGIFKSTEVSSYRSYFTTLSVPNLNVESSFTSGNKVDLNEVLKKKSLLNMVIDKSVVGSPGQTKEPCSLILDGKTTTKFCTSTVPSTIAWTMKEPVTLESYVIYTANDNDKFPGRRPKKWALFGSNDGKKWTCISSIESTLPIANYSGSAYTVERPGSYLYYAMKVLETAGDNMMQFSELGLYGSAEETPTGVSYDTLDEKLPFYVKAIGNQKISINYTCNLDNDTNLSIYNLMGSSLINKSITESESIVKMSEPGFYIVTIKSGTTRIMKKVLVN